MDDTVRYGNICSGDLRGGGTCSEVLSSRIVRKDQSLSRGSHKARSEVDPW